MSELPELVVADAAGWRAWLDEHEAAEPGVWLVLAKKGTTSPTSLTYDQALDEALCSGWIDGQVRRRDERTFTQRFTARRPRSVWSVRNTGHVARLQEQGRMRPSGLAQVQAAQADGRWQAAYAGSATIEVPPDLAEALAARPEAMAVFAGLDRQNRYAVLYRITSAAQPATRAARVAGWVERLARGDLAYPRGG